MNTRELKLVNGCPKWCVEDHTVQAAEDREHHCGTPRELRLPDGQPVLEASLTIEPGQGTPRLVVVGSLATVVDQVQLLAPAAARAFEAEVQRFASHVSRMTATLGTDPQPPKPTSKKRKTLPPSMQHAGPEMRLYLAERDGRHCFYCRTPFDRLREATADHYIPRSMWACNLPANLVLACEPCNRTKDDRLTWSMAAVLLAWAGREAPEAGEQPPLTPAVAACS